MVVSTGSSPRSERLPLLQRLELDGVRGDIGHVEPRQHLLGGPGVVVGGAADQREAGERNERVDLAILPFLKKNFSIAGRASRPVAKAGMTCRPRASSAAITPS